VRKDGDKLSPRGTFVAINASVLDFLMHSDYILPSFFQREQMLSRRCAFLLRISKRNCAKKKSDIGICSLNYLLPFAREFGMIIQKQISRNFHQGENER